MAKGKAKRDEPKAEEPKPEEKKPVNFYDAVEAALRVQSGEDIIFRVRPSVFAWEDGTINDLALRAYNFVSEKDKETGTTKGIGSGFEILYFLTGKRDELKALLNKGEHISKEGMPVSSAPRVLSSAAVDDDSKRFRSRPIAPKTIVTRAANGTEVNEVLSRILAAATDFSEFVKRQNSNAADSSLDELEGKVQKIPAILQDYIRLNNAHLEDAGEIPDIALKMQVIHTMIAAKSDDTRIADIKTKAEEFDEIAKRELDKISRPSNTPAAG